MSKLVLPNFFIVGTGKAGTTSLYHYVRQHPQIYMSPVKEPCYFASEVCAENLTPLHLAHIRRMSRKFSHRLPARARTEATGWLVKDWEDYLALFQDAGPAKAVGEASVVYLWSATAPKRIAADCPHARIIMILRDPAERAFSQYCHQLAFGIACPSFREHIAACVNNRDEKISAHYPFLEVGKYYRQVQRYYESFPQSNIRIYWYEEAWRNPGLFLQNVFEFLEVDSNFRPDMSKRSLERKAPRFPAVNSFAKRFEAVHRLNEMLPSAGRTLLRRLMFDGTRRPEMDAAERRFLVDYYREDILQLSSFLNRNLDAWLQV